ncbi:hypothetical protein MSAN_01844100 [Mycena sanguinolenta]|uniref:Rho termination factor N-terminal domain-containing protein n=1 Tax=Mycena sanguinolenta TaxID=230812 RepID=A0A8H6XQK8_9AGAR|nr:hypothetical protein MSAN_01844100 [Mycena sanguinolenta]
MPTESELKKLTVSQLKALCKEQRISGYSKLAKDAIIQKLLAASSPTQLTTQVVPDKSAATHSATPSSENTTSSPSNPARDTIVPAGADGGSTLEPFPQKPSNPPASQSHTSTAPVDASTSTRVDAQPDPKSRPKKQKKAPATPSQSDTRVPSTPHAPLPEPNPAPAASTPNASQSSPPNATPAASTPSTPLQASPPNPTLATSSISSQPSPLNPTLTASTGTSSQSSVPNPTPDVAIPPVDAQPAAKPRPKKKKSPPPSSGSQSSVPTSASDPVFKVPALPQRLIQDSSTAVPTVPITSTSASVPTTTASASTTAAKKRKIADKSTPDSDGVAAASTAPKKRKKDPPTDSVPSPAEATTASSTASKKKKTAAPTNTISSATKATTLPTASSSTASQKKKTVAPTNSVPSAAKPATPNAFTPPAASSSRASAAPLLPTIDSNIPSVSDHPPKTPKRPAGPTATDQPPPKKQKLAPLLPTAQPSASKVLLPQAAPPPLPAVVPIPQDAAQLPQPKAKRFVPLVVTKKPQVPVAAPAPLVPSTAVPPAISNDASVVEVLYHLDFPTTPAPPLLTSITLPPKKSERKRVPNLSVRLSFLADEDIGKFVSVSRVFRYAAYLSAVDRLKREFTGQRLKLMLEKYPQATTNMWPYLRQRRQEVSTRKQEYRTSFLSRAITLTSGSESGNPISERLWTSPDHERQIVIALRFLLTRLFFSVSVGGGREGKGWDEGQIVDAQELVAGEVWTITVQHSAISKESFYVLEPTCEPLTAVPDSVSSAGTVGVPVRADWATYIAQRASSKEKSPVPRLLECLSWTNHEEYQLGISRLWLRRIEGEGETGRMKRVMAERYILACVVANSLSGRYMSATQMAQDFAGLPEGAPARAILNPKVNLFLPAHHHVESVHFTTSGRALHSALAIVQTPGRMYFILRDNGMQVGCEEEGVAEVWMNILGCNSSGVALQK